MQSDFFLQVKPPNLFFCSLTKYMVKATVRHPEFKTCGKKKFKCANQGHSLNIKHTYTRYILFFIFSSRHTPSYTFRHFPFSLSVTIRKFILKVKSARRRLISSWREVFPSLVNHFPSPLPFIFCLFLIAGISKK